MVARPLKYDGSNVLQDMSDADLERLTYNLQAAYAAQLNANGNGYIYIGASGTSIGSASDTSATQQVNAVEKITNDGIIQGYPSYPGTGSETDTTYSYRQDRNVPTAVSSATFNVDGMTFYDSANDYIIPFTTEAQLAAIIVDQAITNMRTGDEVGSYRVSTSTPSNGGAGTWTSKGVWFSDTTYSAGTTNYNLYLKLDLTTPPGSSISPVGLEDDGGGTPTGSLQERSDAIGDDLVQNVLLPALTRKMSSGLYYSVATSTSGIVRGTFTDTKQTATTNSQVLSATTIDGIYGTFYQSISSPSGTASTVNTYYLNMLA